MIQRIRETLNNIESRIEKLESRLEPLHANQDSNYIHPQYEGRTIQAPL